MKKIILLALVFLITASPLLAKSGVGYYAIQSKHFPCDRALQVFDGVKKARLMFLWNTFGESRKCLDKFFALPQEKEVYIHFSNECCRRNNNCKAGELLRGYSVSRLNKLIEAGNITVIGEYHNRANEIRDFVIEHDDVKFFISTGLEDNYSPVAKKKVYNLLRKIFKKYSNVTVYVNPLNASCVTSKCEIHEKNLGKNHWLYIPDGYCVKPLDKCNKNVFTEKELKERLSYTKRRKLLFFIWWQGQQGLWGQPTALAPAPRKRRIRITKKQVLYINKIIKEK